MRILQVPYRACAGAIFAWRDRECHARVEAKNQGRKPCRYGEMMLTRRCLFVLDCAVRCGSLNFCLLFLRPLCFFVSFFYFPRDRLLCSDSFSWLVTSSKFFFILFRHHAGLKVSSSFRCHGPYKHQQRLDRPEFNIEPQKTRHMRWSRRTKGQKCTPQCLAQTCKTLCVSTGGLCQPSQRRYQA